MRYRLEILSKVFEVEVTPKSDGKGIWISIDGELFDDKNLEELPIEILFNKKKNEYGESFHLKTNLKQMDIYLRPLDSILVKNNSSKGSEQSFFHNIFTPEGRLIAPMPGKIVNIKCQEGETVLEAQLLLVFEAMKMENEIRSPVSGKIIRILVSEGSFVTLNQVLIEISAI